MFCKQILKTSTPDIKGITFCKVLVMVFAKALLLLLLLQGYGGITYCFNVQKNCLVLYMN